MLKAVKIRIYPSEEQATYIARLLGTCRFVYNGVLAYKIEEYNTNKKSVSFGEMGRKMVALKEEFPWIKESHSKVLQQSLINLDSAYKSFFKNGSGFPKFKSKHDSHQSCRFPVDAFSGIKGNRVSIIKPLKDILFRCSVRDERYLNKHQTTVRSATLSRTKTNKYFLSILVDGDFVPNRIEPTNDIIGIDLGIKDFVVTSEGKRFVNLKIIRSNERKLARLQRFLSKKQKDSKNREKARVRLASFHEKLNNRKEHYLHEVANSLLGENQTIAVENLNVTGMLANHKLARSIQELSLHRFKFILTYKAAWMGRDLIEIDQFFPSSKLCGECGEKNDGLRLSDRTWVCPCCRTQHDRDLNAARNIQGEGKRILSIKQIGLSSPDFKPLEIATKRSMKKEKNVACMNKRI